MPESEPPPVKVNLEVAFKETAERPAGSCPLPEPSRGAPETIEQPEHMTVKEQPPGYNYDEAPNNDEATRFAADVKQIAETDPSVAKWLEENPDEIK